MILLKKLQLNNFLSHEKTEINFTEEEKALIDGASGAGKSSIFDGILWALYGQGRSDNRTLVKKGSKKGSVCLELIQQGTGTDRDVIIITRSVGQNGTHKLEVAIQKPDGSRTAYPLSGIKELQAWIDHELIGASYPLFINSVAYVQGNSESFVSQTAPKRKELLLEIIRAEDYTKHYESARRTLANLENDHQRANGQIVELEARFEALGARGAGREAYINTISENTSFIKEIEPKIKDLEDEKTSVSAALQALVTFKIILVDRDVEKHVLKLDLEEKNKKVAGKREFQEQAIKATSFIADSIEAKKELNNLRDKLVSASGVEEERNKYYANKPVVNDRSLDVKRHEEQIDFLGKKEPCPSGDKCPYHSKTIEAIQYHKTELDKLKTLVTDEVHALEAWKKEEAKLPPAVDIRLIVAEIKSVEEKLHILENNIELAKAAQNELNNIEKIESEIPGLKNLIEEKNKQIEELGSKVKEIEQDVSVEEVDSLNNLLQDSVALLRHSTDEISKAKAMLETIDKDEEEAREVGKRITQIREKEIKEILEKSRKVALVKDAFGSKGGIETMVIDYLLPKLEDKINDVLSRLSDFRVRLDTQRKSADGESTVEGLFITILNEANEELPFEVYSGGEKLKISVAISEALATMQRVGFRLFDETFIGLDENSTESFAGVLNELQNNFSQILCISHLLQIKDLFDKKIILVKNKSTSYVR